MEISTPPRHGRPRLFACLALSASLSCSAHAAASFITEESPCNPVRVDNCVLPYPSDLYTVPDADSATGKIINVPFSVLRSQIQAELPPTLTPEAVFGGSSGFSAATTVLFELDQAPDLATLPGDGGNAVVALDLDTGERVPVRALLNEYARSNKVTAAKQVVEIYPQSRWKFSGRYVVGLTKNLKTQSGGNFVPSAGFAAALNDVGSDLNGAYAPALQVLESYGIKRDELISATFFTIRTEEEVTGPMRRIAADVYAADHPVRNLTASYTLTGPIGVIVRGEVLISNYRGADHNLDYSKPEGDEYWTRFRLTIPRVAKRGSVPVAIYGHGLSILKESDLLVSIINAGEGVATVSIDQPNHGTRIRRDGGYALSNVRVDSVPLQVGMTAQSPIDFIALLKAVKTSIGAIDVLPKKLFSPLVGQVKPGRNGDGIPDLDVNNVFYESTSLGGVLGATFVALAPELKGAFMQVPGVGITSILSGSSLWDLRYRKLEPPSADGAEALMLKAVMQHQIDYGDAVNFVHYIHNPVPGNDDKKLAMVVAKNDGIVPNFSSTALAQLTDTPIIGRQRFDMPGVRVTGTPEFENGNGLVQVPALLVVGLEELDALASHGAFIDPRATAALQRWIRQEITQK